MKLGNIEINNAKLGENQIQKVMHGLETIWENWKAFTTTILNPTSGSFNDSGFVSGQCAIYEIPENTKITSVDCEASVYVHGDNASASLYATIEVSNDKSSWVQVAKTDQKAVSGKGNSLTHTVSYDFGNDGCTYKYIRCCSRGTSFKRTVKGVFNGFKKGSD